MNPQYHAITRSIAAGDPSDRMFSLKCQNLVQIALWIRNWHEPETITPIAYKGMKAWDQLTTEMQKLLIVARSTMINSSGRVAKNIFAG